MTDCGVVGCTKSGVIPVKGITIELTPGYFVTPDSMLCQEHHDRMMNRETLNVSSRVQVRAEEIRQMRVAWPQLTAEEVVKQVFSDSEPDAEQIIETYGDQCAYEAQKAAFKEAIECVERKRRTRLWPKADKVLDEILEEFRRK